MKRRRSTILLAALFVQGALAPSSVGSDEAWVDASRYLLEGAARSDESAVHLVVGGRDQAGRAERFAIDAGDTAASAEQKLQDLQNEVQYASEQVRMAQERASIAVSACYAAECKRSELEEECSKLQRQVQALSECSEVRALELADKDNQIALLDSQVESLQKQIGTKEGELSQDNLELKRHRSALQSQSAELQGQVRSLNAQRSADQRLLEELSKQLDEARKAIGVTEVLVSAAVREKLRQEYDAKSAEYKMELASRDEVRERYNKHRKSKDKAAVIAQEHICAKRATELAGCAAVYAQNTMDASDISNAARCSIKAHVWSVVAACSERVWVCDDVTEYNRAMEIFNELGQATDEDLVRLQQLWESELLELVQQGMHAGVLAQEESLAQLGELRARVEATTRQLWHRRIVIGVLGALMMAFGGAAVVEMNEISARSSALSARCQSELEALDNTLLLQNAAADVCNKDSTAATQEAVITQEYAAAQRVIEAAECYHTLAQQTGDSDDQGTAKRWSLRALAYEAIATCSVQSWVNNNNAGHNRAGDMYNAVNNMTDAEVAASEAQYKAELEGLRVQCIKDSVAGR